MGAQRNVIGIQTVQHHFITYIYIRLAAITSRWACHYELCMTFRHVPVEISRQFQAINHPYGLPSRQLFKFPLKTVDARASRVNRKRSKCKRCCKIERWILKSPLKSSINFERRTRRTNGCWWERAEKMGQLRIRNSKTSGDGLKGRWYSSGYK